MSQRVQNIQRRSDEVLSWIQTQSTKYQRLKYSDELLDDKQDLEVSTLLISQKINGALYRCLL